MTTDDKIGEGLLDYDRRVLRPGSPGVKAEYARIIWRARASVRMYATVAILLWAVVAIGFAAYASVIRIEIFPRLSYTLAHYEQLDQRQILSQLVTVVEWTTYLANFFWNALAVLLALAAFFTCVFVVMSRRETLRQIHASLGDIADQLKVLSQNKKE